MQGNKYLAWTSFVLFVLSVGLILLLVLFATLFSDTIENLGVVILVIGAFSLLGTITGFLAFKAPQARVGGIGGLVILLLVLFVTPLGSRKTVTPPQPDANTTEQGRRTGITEIDLIIDTVLSGNPEEKLRLLQFSALACTRAEGLGGPPKCRDGEEEGTLVEAFPFLGPEGHHMRKSEAGDWEGIQASDVYAVYRVSAQAYSDEAYPSGEYAIVFRSGTEPSFVTAQVRDGKIVRIDYRFGNSPEIDLGRDASEIILAPQN